MMRPVAPSPAPSELPRKLTLFDGAALLVGGVIGSGIFVVPSLIARHVPEPGLVLFIWTFSGLLVLSQVTPNRAKTLLAGRPAQPPREGVAWQRQSPGARVG